VIAYQNLDTIQFYSFEWDLLWKTQDFSLKTDWDQLHGITIQSIMGSWYSIERCIPVPVDDCYQDLEDQFN
jgi:hypothetical protein